MNFQLQNYTFVYVQKYYLLIYQNNKTKNFLKHYIFYWYFLFLCQIRSQIPEFVSKLNWPETLTNELKKKKNPYILF